MFYSAKCRQLQTRVETLFEKLELLLTANHAAIVSGMVGDLRGAWLPNRAAIVAL
jgi:hypothetical protein